jgi:hypothetical protein
MRRFRVLLEGAPVFLRNTESEQIERLGFYTTRWVEASSREEAGALACRMALDDLAGSGTENPPGQPVQVAVDEIVEVSWFEMLRRSPGRGFTFYQDDDS